MELKFLKLSKEGMDLKSSILQLANKKNLLLLGIVILAAVLRFAYLSSIPPSLSHDEAAIGYNAWSIVETGKDEYGNPFPFLFRSFDDYKLPGYIYSTSFFQFIFGNTHLAVRFTSALLGTLSVLVVYFLSKQILVSSQNKRYQWFSYISAFVFAISPWSINFSRAAFETNGSVFFIALSALFLLKSRKAPPYLILSIISAVIAMYFYYTARILLPFLLLSFLVLNIRYFFSQKKHIIISFVVGVVLIAPIIPYMVTNGMERINQVSIFNDKSFTNPYSEAILRHENSLDSRIVYNRRVAHFQNFTNNYFKNLSPDYYFANGTGPMGLLYFWEAPFFILGMYFMTKLKGSGKWVILLWFFFVPVVAGLTIEQPNPLRTLPAVVPAALFTSLGIHEISRILSKKRIYNAALGVFVVIVVLFFIRFLYLYFDYYPNITANRWIEGSRELAQFIKQKGGEYDTVYMSGANWRPYIHMLYYMDYPPEKYQNENGNRFHFSNMYFASAGWDSPGEMRLMNADLSKLEKGKTAFVLTKEDYDRQIAAQKTKDDPYSFDVVTVINGKYVKEAFYVVELR